MVRKAEDVRPWRQPGQNPYQTPRWRKLRAQILKFGFCVMCGDRATLADHIIPHRGDMRLFWEPSNLQPLCRPCHNSVKARDERSEALRGVSEDGTPLDPSNPWYEG